MDPTEKIALDHLTNRGLANIVYEPDGNVPPDFLIDGRIAVEVRRLNQNVETPDGPQGLEEDEYPLHARFKRLLPELGPPLNGESWYTFYDFERPLLPWRELKDQIGAALIAFRDAPGRPTQPSASLVRPLPVAPGFTLSFLRAGPGDRPHFFIDGGHSDSDSGGWLMSEMPKNIRVCIEEKARKIARVRGKYAKWWLLLVDRIGYGGPDRREQETLRRLVGALDPWAKIIVVNPLVPTQAFEL